MIPAPCAGARAYVGVREGNAGPEVVNVGLGRVPVVGGGSGSGVVVGGVSLVVGGVSLVVVVGGGTVVVSTTVVGVVTADVVGASVVVVIGATVVVVVTSIGEPASSSRVRATAEPIPATRATDAATTQRRATAARGSLCTKDAALT